MQFSELQTWFARHMGQESSAVGTTDRDAYLNEANKDIAVRLRCIAAEDTSITTVADTERYTLPTDLIPGSILRVVWDDDRLIGRRFSIQDDFETVTTSGNPRYYYIFGNKIGLLPVPSSAETVTILYAKTPDTLTNAGDVSELPTWLHDLVPLGAAAMSLVNRESPLAEAKVSAYELNLREARRRINSGEADEMLVAGSRRSLETHSFDRLRYDFE